MGKKEKEMKVEAEKPKRYASADEVFLKVNPWGKYQWYLAMLYGYHFTIVGINDGFMAFGGMLPEFQCLDNSTSAAGYNYNNTVVSSVKEHCDLYQNCNGTNPYTNQSNFQFVSTFYSIVEQYQLVCDKAYFVDLITTLQFVGICIGAISSGPVVDYLGRKWTFLVVVAAEMAAGSLVAVAPTWEVHAAMRMLIGICAGADMNAGWVFLGEFTSNRYRFLFRAIAGIIPGLSFPIVAIITRDWRLFELVGNLQCLPLLVIIPLTTFESPRWLIQRGRHEEACQVFQKVARINGEKGFTVRPEELPLPPARKTEPFWRLFESWRVTKYSICGIVTWFVASTINFGMFFDSGNLPFNVYVTQFVIGVANIIFELPIAWVDMHKPHLINRRLLLIGFMILCVVINAGLGLLFLLQLHHDKSLSWLFMVLSVSGQLLISVVFDTAYVYSIELFPTLLRSQAGAMCSASARLGGIIAPQVLFTQTLCDQCAGIPYMAFAAVGAFGVVVDWFLLPNTKDKALLEDYKDEMTVLKDQPKDAAPGLEVEFSASYGSASIQPPNPINGDKKSKY